MNRCLQNPACSRFVPIQYLQLFTMIFIDFYKVLVFCMKQPFPITRHIKKQVKMWADKRIFYEFQAFIGSSGVQSMNRCQLWKQIIGCFNEFFSFFDTSLSLSTILGG